MSNLFVSQYEGLVEWGALDITEFGGGVYRWVNSSLDRARDEPTADFFGMIDWQGEAWTGVPFETASWRKGESTDKPKVVLPDFQSIISTTLDLYKGAPGAPFYRYQSIGLGAPISVERYLVRKVQAIPGFKVTLELATVLDATDAKFPAYIMTRKDFPGLGPALQR